MRPPPNLTFSTSSHGFVTSPSVYEWVRNFHGLMPLRGSCWTHCWMSDAASTEWKSFSRPDWNYVAWLPGSTPHSVFKSMTLGTRSLFVSAKQQYEMNTQVLKNVQRLRILKCLTSDDLNARLTETSVSATKPSRAFVYGIVAPRIYGKTSLQLSRSVSSSQLWSAEGSDPIQDIVDWKRRMREEYEEAGVDGLF